MGAVLINAVSSPHIYSLLESRYSRAPALASHLQPYAWIRLEIKKPSWIPRRAGERGHDHETVAVL
jgi:hypothetical protein